MHALHLERNCVTLTLPDPNAVEDVSDEDSSDDDDGLWGGSNKEAKGEDMGRCRTRRRLAGSVRPADSSPRCLFAARRILVEVDLALTAFANARAHHDRRKAKVVKAEKTIAAEAAAVKTAEQKAMAQLKKVGEAGRAEGCGAAQEGGSHARLVPSHL